MVLLQCKLSSSFISGGDFGLISAMSVSSLVVITLISTTVMATVILLLIRAKAKNHRVLKELAQAKATAIYEEIVDKTPPSSPGVGTEKNVAYEQAAEVCVK